MRDREGFAELLRNLDSFDIAYTINEVPQGLYDAAQQIGCVQGVPGVTASGSSIRTGSTTKTFRFGEELLTSFLRKAKLRYEEVYCEEGGGDELDGVGSDGDTFCHGGSSRSIARGLLRTAKENFVILTVGCTIDADS